MSRSKPISSNYHFDNSLNEQIDKGCYQLTRKARLDLLRLKLEMGENSVLIRGFNTDKFINQLHKKYISL